MPNSSAMLTLDPVVEVPILDRVIKDLDHFQQSTMIEVPTLDRVIEDLDHSRQTTVTVVQEL